VHEIHARREALEAEGPADVPAALTFAELPAVELAELLAGLWVRQRGGLGGASRAVAIGQAHLLGIVRSWVELGLPWAASSVGERLPHTQEVIGSNPMPPTRKQNVAPSSSGLGRSPLKAETAGSNPAGATNCHESRRS